MKLKIEDTTLEVDSATLAKINEAIKECPMMKNCYDSTTEKYYWKATGKTAQFNSIEAIEVVTAGH